MRANVTRMRVCSYLRPMRRIGCVEDGAKHSGRRRVAAEPNLQRYAKSHPLPKCPLLLFLSVRHEQSEREFGSRWAHAGQPREVGVGAVRHHRCSKREGL